MKQPQTSANSVSESDDHRSLFVQIRNHLAGQAVGLTRDSSMLNQIVGILFCLQYMESKQSLPSNEASDAQIAAQFRRTLTTLRRSIPGALQETEKFELADPLIAYVSRTISHVGLSSSKHDWIGDAFEIFTGSDARGQEGQFFTPQNAVRLLIDLVDPKPGETIIDPACGSGAFLSSTAQRWIDQGVEASSATHNLWGIDKDRYLASLASTRLAMYSMSPSNVECGDSLAWRTESGEVSKFASLAGTFDVVLANPPFGSKIVAASPDIQSTFELGYKWKLVNGSFVRSKSLTSNVAPQVLFIERCMNLAKPGGRIGIVVPESLISSRNHRYVVSWIRENAYIRAVVGMPETLFKTSGKGGTHTKTCLLVLQKKGGEAKSSSFKSVFMAEARFCGNDSRGRRSERDELPIIAQRWTKQRANIPKDHLGYLVPLKSISEDILAPRFYNPEVAAELAVLATTHDLIRIGDLVDEGTLTITTGHEVGAAEYGTGDIPFVRTSDISVNADRKQPH